MIPYKNNWLEWSYDGVIDDTKRTPHSKFELIINKASSPYLLSHRNELACNALWLRDRYKGQYDLFLSGGYSSQVIFHVMKDLKLPFKAVIVRYENGYNNNDFITAKRLCMDYGVPYNIIDLNIQHFFENEAIDYFNKCHTVNVHNLLLMKMREFTHHTAVIGNRLPYVQRDSVFYEDNVGWKIKLTEDEMCIPTVFAHDDKCIADWFFHSPEVIVSFLKEPTIKDMIKDNTDGFAFTANKFAMYNKYWPIMQRGQMSGLRLDNCDVLPRFITDFYEQVIHDRVTQSNPISFTREELLKAICYDVNN